MLEAYKPLSRGCRAMKGGAREGARPFVRTAVGAYGGESLTESNLEQGRFSTYPHFSATYCLQIRG